MSKAQFGFSYAGEKAREDDPDVQRTLMWNFAVDALSMLKVKGRKPRVYTGRLVVSRSKLEMLSVSVSVPLQLFVLKMADHVVAEARRLGYPGHEKLRLLVAKRRYTPEQMRENDPDESLKDFERWLRQKRKELELVEPAKDAKILKAALSLKLTPLERCGICADGLFHQSTVSGIPDKNKFEKELRGLFKRGCPVLRPYFSVRP